MLTTVLYWMLVIYSIFFLPSKEYNMSYEITEDYILEKDGVVESTDVILFSRKDFELNKEENESRICKYVDEFTQIGDYYIGHFDGFDSERKKCRNYFYIKKDNTDVKFNVSEKEIKEKFGDVKFKMSPANFVDEYGI